MKLSSWDTTFVRCWMEALKAATKFQRHVPIAEHLPFLALGLFKTATDTSNEYTAESLFFSEYFKLREQGVLEKAVGKNYYVAKKDLDLSSSYPVKPLL